MPGPDRNRPRAPVPSPCVARCAIGADGRCEGCARTLDQIARWGAMTDAERLALMAELPARPRAERL